MKAVVILEVMWDWRSMTTRGGYKQQAPRWFNINPDNFSGRRLHRWLADYEFVVTNACPELVSSASGRGTASKEWLSANLKELAPFDLLLVCGAVARATYNRADAGQARVIELQHPAARSWTKQGIELVTTAIRSGRPFNRITRIHTSKLFTLEDDTEHLHEAFSR